MVKYKYSNLFQLFLNKKDCQHTDLYKLFGRKENNFELGTLNRIKRKKQLILYLEIKQI